MSIIYLTHACNLLQAPAALQQSAANMLKWYGAAGQAHVRPRRATPGRGDARQLLINLKVLSRSEPVIMTECAGLNLGLSFTDHLIGLGDPQRVEVLPPPPQPGHGEREREREGREEEGEGEEEKSGSGYWQETSLRVLAVHSGWQIRVIGCQYASASDTDSESHSGRITENESCSGSLCLPESECDQ